MMFTSLRLQISKKETRKIQNPSKENQKKGLPPHWVTLSGLKNTCFVCHSVSLEDGASVQLGQRGSSLHCFWMKMSLPCLKPRGSAAVLIITKNNK